MARNESKPDETAAAAIGPAGCDRDGGAGIAGTEAGTGTASHKPSATEGSPGLEDDAGEYILEREPDGRYRIAGRRARQQK